MSTRQRLLVRPVLGVRTRAERAPVQLPCAAGAACARNELLLGAQLALGGGDLLLPFCRLLSLDLPGVILLVRRTVGRAALLRECGEFRGIL